MRTFGLWAAVVAWHDGDTFYGALDQGFGTFKAAGMAVVLDLSHVAMIELVPARHRLYGIDAAELSTGQAGTDATTAAAELVPPGIYPATSYKPDNFGRPLVDLVLPDGRTFADAMRAAGFAVPYKREITG